MDAAIANARHGAFSDAFFSVETISTIGYGQMSPTPSSKPSRLTTAYRRLIVDNSDRLDLDHRVGIGRSCSRPGLSFFSPTRARGGETKKIKIDLHR
jgi:hypothetical protein